MAPNTPAMRAAAGAFALAAAVTTWLGAVVVLIVVDGTTMVVPGGVMVLVDRTVPPTTMVVMESIAVLAYWINWPGSGQLTISLNRAGADGHVSVLRQVCGREDS